MPTWRASRQLIDRVEDRAAAAAPLHPAGRHADRRGAARRAHGLPPGRAPHGRADAAGRPLVVRYMNRLSDLLFVLARAVNHRARRTCRRLAVVAARALARAYAACERLAQSHYENFPVASRLLPAAMRPHVAAVYAFARIADDIADEGTAPAGRAAGAPRRLAAAAARRRRGTGRRRRGDRSRRR